MNSFEVSDFIFESDRNKHSKKIHRCSNFVTKSCLMRFNISSFTGNKHIFLCIQCHHNTEYFKHYQNNRVSNYNSPMCNNLFSPNVRRFMLYLSHSQIERHMTMAKFISGHPS